MKNFSEKNKKMECENHAHLFNFLEHLLEGILNAVSTKICKYIISV